MKSTVISLSVVQYSFFLLDDQQFKDLLMKDKQYTRAPFSVCHKVMELSSSGKLAMTNHGKCQKHRNVCQNYRTFLSQEWTGVTNQQAEIINST